jgi:PIN domain nuclease of toxin-antitoxin system
VPPILLDTCALIWLVQDEPLSPPSVQALRDLNEQGGLLFQMSARSWFAKASEAPGVKLAGMLPDVLIASSFLPGKPPRDPADRIIAATARELGAMLVTRDKVLLDYGKQGHVNVLKC